MISRFSFYDFIAVLIPGIFFLWSLSTFTGIPVAALAGSGWGDLAETSILVVVGYVTGLLLQGVSQSITERVLLKLWGGFPSARWLSPGDSHFTTEYRKGLAAAITKVFGVIIEPTEHGTGAKKPDLKRNQEIFYLCYRSVEKASDLPQTFNAQYGLFRSLLTTFAILGILAVVQIINYCRWGMGWDKRAATILVLAVIGVVLAYLRTAKRANDFAKSVYDTFLTSSATTIKT